MSDFLKKIKTNSLITAAIYAVLGLVLLIWPDLSAGLFCTALGAVLVICGMVDVIIFLTHRDGSLYAGGHLLVGVVLAVVGIYVMARPTLVAMAVPVIVGILMCIHGLGDIGDAITLRRGGYQRWGAALVLGIVTAALGAVLIRNPFTVFETVVRIIGICLLYDGVTDIWIASRVSKTLRQAKKDAEAQSGAVDVNFTDVKDK